MLTEIWKTERFLKCLLFTDFSLYLSAQTGSEAHPASCPVVAEGSFVGSKAAWPGS